MIMTTLDLGPLEEAAASLRGACETAIEERRRLHSMLTSCRAFLQTCLEHQLIDEDFTAPAELMIDAINAELGDEDDE